MPETIDFSEAFPSQQAESQDETIDFSEAFPAVPFGSQNPSGWMDNPKEYVPGTDPVIDQEQAVSAYTQGQGTIDTSQPLSFWQRVGTASKDTPEEVQASLERDFPGEKIKVHEVPMEAGGTELFYSKGDDKKLYPVNPAGLDTGDLGGFVADLPQVAGESLMWAAGGKYKTGARLALGALGAGAGEAGKQIYQTMTGQQRQNDLEVAGEIGAEAGISYAGGQVMRGATALVNKARGAVKPVDMDPETYSIWQELQSRGMEVPPDLLTDNPVVKGIVKQVRQSSASIDKLERVIKKQMTDELEGMVRAAKSQARPADLSAQAEMALREERASLSGRFAWAKQTMQDAGVAVSSGLDRYVAASREYERMAWKRAHTAVGEDPNIMPGVGDLPKVAADISKEVPARFTDKQTLAGMSLEQRIEVVLSDVLDPPNSVTEKSVVSIRGKLGEIAALMADPKFNGTPQSFQTMKKLRSHVGEIIERETRMDGTKTSLGRHASRLYASMSSAIADGLQAESPAAKKLWDMANAASRNRWADIDGRLFREYLASKKGDPIAVARMVMDNPDRAVQAAKFLSPKEMGTIRKSYVDAIASDPASISKKLDELARTSIDAHGVLVGPRLDRQLRKFQLDVDAFNNSPLNKAYESGLRDAELALNLVRGKSREQVRSVVQQFGYGSKGHDALKATIVDDIFQSARVADSHGRVSLDPRKLRAKIDEYNDGAVSSGALSAVFTKKELDALKSLDRINWLFSKSASSTGASLQVHADIADMLTIFRGNVVGAAKGAADLKMRALIGKLVTSPAGQHMLIAGKSFSKVGKPAHILLAELLATESKNIVDLYGEVADETKRPYVEDNRDTFGPQP